MASGSRRHGWKNPKAILEGYGSHEMITDSRQTKVMTETCYKYVAMKSDMTNAEDGII